MADACNSCGAEIVFEAGKQSLTCPFCGAVNKIERAEDALETSFDRIVPISVTRQDLENLAYAHMASGKFTPDDMLEASTITLRELFYVPAFAFKVDYDATWTASFGFDRKEPYTAHRTVYSNGRSRQESYTAYRTVTDWRPANGVDSGAFKVAGYAGSRLVGMPLAPVDLVEQTVMSGSSTEFNPSFTTGFEIEKFSVPKKKVYQSLKSEINSIIGEKVERHGQGDKQRDWHWNAKMSHAATTYAVPICHIAFQYDDKEYCIWVGGDNASAIRADMLPVDKDKQKAANIGFIPGGLGLLATAGSTYFWGFAGVSLIATAIALGYGFMRRKSLIDYSKSIRSSLLTQMQASNQTGANLSAEHQSKVAKAFQRPVRPFFAQIHKDKIVLPAFAAFTFLGAVVPNATLSPTAVRQRAYAQSAPSQFSQNVEMQAAQDRAEQEAASQQAAAAEQAASQAQEEALAAENADPVNESLPDGAAEEAHSEAENAQPAASLDNSSASRFVVIAPEESTHLLSSMLQQATSAYKISEIKGLIEALPKPTAGDRKAARKLNDQGLEALKANDFEQAIAILKNAAATDPADVEALNNYMFALIKGQHIPEAESEAGRLLTMSPGRSSAWANLAEIYALKNNKEESAAALVLAFQFSSNKDRTITFLNDRSVDQNSPLQAPSLKAIEVIQKM